MSEFDELKVQAKELGVKIHGLKTPELKAAVEEAKIARDANPVQTSSDIDPIGNDQALPVTTEPAGLTQAAIKASEPAKVDAPKMPEIKKTFNMVVLYKDKQEIRNYSLQIHGKDFATIAAGFAAERGLRMEFIDTGKNISCPKCGHSFAPRS